MNNKRYIISVIALFLLLFPLVTNAQYGNTGISQIGVKSLRIGGKYTKQQVIAAMGGQPSLYLTWEDEFGLGESYHYGGENVNVLDCMENGILVGFVIVSAQYPVFEQYKGGIRVGDSIKKLHNLNIPYCSLVKKSNTEYWFGANDEWVEFKVNSLFNLNIITQISFSDPT